jgi:putative flippase GtrA
MMPNYRYLITTGSAALTDFVLLYILHKSLNLNITLSVAISFSAAFLVNYVGSRRWVFKKDSHSAPRESSFVKYTSLTIANLFVQSFGVTGLVYVGVNFLLAKIILVAILFFVNFVISKRFIF